MSLIDELKQRKLVQWAVAYVAAAFALLQGFDIVGQKFGWPDSVGRILIIALCIGFFVTLLLAWYHGERGAQKVSGAELLLLALVLAIGGGFLWQFGLRTPAPAGAGSAAEGDKPAPAGPAALERKSIAVLPFVNMSADADNEFFADGLSEEILNSLARIDGMLVVGRTSSFQFKGKNEDLRTIGEKLGVANVLEGSVRREGERARITAQLIRTADGIHLWSETYDRTVDDALAVQLDIAEKVAGVLDVVLDEGQRSRMRAAGIRSVDAFVEYQKGMRLYMDAHARPDLDLLETLARANAEFARATQLEPGFSLAWFASADRFEHLLMTDGRSATELLDAQRSALRVLESAAATGHDEQQRLLNLGERQMLSDDWHGLPARIDAAFRQPGCNVSNWLPVFAGAFGYGDEIEDFGKRASACNPLDFINFNTRFRVALANGHPQLALSILAQIEKARGASPGSAAQRAIALTMLGRADEAAALLEREASAGPDLAHLIVARARGEDLAPLVARLRTADHTRAKYQEWDLFDLEGAATVGDRVEANRRAAALDARPAGPFLLARVTADCLCGAPFDLDATPNFKARLAESGLRWPPPATMKYPPLAQAPRP